jgi:hypothetical protein
MSQQPGSVRQALQELRGENLMDGRPKTDDRRTNQRDLRDLREK